MADTLQEWIGRQQQASDEVSLAAIKRLAALLDVPPRPYRRGDPIPKGWYAVLFTPEERQSQLGPDGHPHKGQFIPPVALPRRMFAGRRVGGHDAAAREHASRKRDRRNELPLLEMTVGPQ